MGVFSVIRDYGFMANAPSLGYVEVAVALVLFIGESFIEIRIGVELRAPIPLYRLF